MKSKKVDLLSVVLVMLIILTPLTMYTLQVINQKANKYVNVLNKISRLEIINKDLHYSYLKKRNFINNNRIDDKVNRFNKILADVKDDVKDDLLASQYTALFKPLEKREFIKNHDLKNLLEKLNQEMQIVSHRYLMVGRVIKNILMIIIMILLPIVLYLHRKSLKDKDSLISYKFAIENSDNSIVITDLDSNIIFVNEAFEKETGYKKEEVLGKNPRVLQSGLMQNDHYKKLYQNLIDKKKWEGEFVNKRKDGTIFYEKASIVPIIVDDKVTSYLAIKLNITDYIEQEKKTEFMAYHDVLTSLPNRLNFEEYFENEIIKKDKEVSLFYMDLDRFKNINDSLGHHVGDELLKIFAKRLIKIVGEDNFVARLGGDEFIAIIDSFMQNEIYNIAEDIVDSFKEPIIIDGHTLSVTTSIGIARYPQDANNLEELMMYADSAMYDAKNHGKNQLQFFTKELSKEINYRVEIEQELRYALEKEELYVVYQPKYSLQTNNIIGFEALIRWENEKLGFVPPDKFINVAEEIGLIVDIGYFVFENACRDFKYFKQIDPTIRSMAINVSPIQLNDIDFLDNINQICQKLEISQTGIELEVTEGYLMDDIETNIKLLDQIREYGYKVAIDDFGTGYSSFAYLKRLPINTLKIDKSFVDDITTNKKDADIVKTIINLAKNLDFNIVAEGIEYKEQEEMLYKNGADIGQGYIFSKPLKINEMREFVKNRVKIKTLV